MAGGRAAEGFDGAPAALDRPGGARGTPGASQRGDAPRELAKGRLPAPYCQKRPPTHAGPAPPRCPWPACQVSVTALRFLQELKSAPAPHPGLRGILSPSPLIRVTENMLTPSSLQCPSLGPSTPSQRRHRKQLHPCRGTERADPGFEGVTLTFQIKPDSSLQILPSYSLTCSSRSLGPVVPTGVPEAHQGSSEEALGPRRCASCKTQTTPLWRDAEDGTPLCNACGIRYKKYGTRCSGCWLVPRKSVQPKRLCGRCGVSLGPLQDAVQEGASRGKTQASGPRALQGEERASRPGLGVRRPPSPQPLLQQGVGGPPPQEVFSAVIACVLREMTIKS
ncbi:GATA-type zinc finger protein 1 [Tamandua tetradactyla]|uniref:GATA-type zinc finger protein 1 n=1 Tax=Tamandua tetradactyla TaxID=48850 RepID=UPI004054182A